MKEIQIWDLDGTVIDSSHRQLTDNTGRLNLEHWVENSTYDKIRSDSLLPHSDEYKKGLGDPDIITIIATARELSINDMAFIHDYLGKPDYYVSRNKGDRRPDYQIKIDGLEAIIKRFSKDIPVKFWDDNITNLEEVNNHLSKLGHKLITIHVG